MENRPFTETDNFYQVNGQYYVIEVQQENETTAVYFRERTDFIRK